MATPRKRHKTRDADATRQALLDAVHRVLLEQGHTGLRTNEIAREAGKDKSLIRYHFGGLAGLLKAYITEKDYWPTFLARYTPTEPVSATELERVFAGT